MQLLCFVHAFNQNCIQLSKCHCFTGHAPPTNLNAAWTPRQSPFRLSIPTDKWAYVQTRLIVALWHITSEANTRQSDYNLPLRTAHRQINILFMGFHRNTSNCRMNLRNPLNANKQMPALNTTKVQTLGLPSSRNTLHIRHLWIQQPYWCCQMF